MQARTERLQSLIEFAKQSALLRATPPQNVSQHKQFNRFEEKVRSLPGLHLNVQEMEFEEIWLRLERLHETRPPIPQSKLVALWIELSNSPQTEPKIRSHVERIRLVEIGALVQKKGDEGDEVSTTVTLDEFPDSERLLQQFQSYLEVFWKKWAAEEIERRRSITLYGELFMLSQQMQGNLVDSQLEFVWGVGVAVWGASTGNVTYPLLSQLVEISLNEADMSLEVRPRSSEPRLEVDIYAAHDNPGVIKLVSAAKKFFGETEAGISPFEPSTFEGLLRSAATFLDSQGVYWPDEISPDDRSLPKAGEHLAVTDTWVLFARPRTSSIFVQDLERFEALLEDNSTLIPDAVGALVTNPSDTSEEVSLPSFRGLSLAGGSGEASSGVVKELYFPMPYNDEQVQIVQNLEAHDGVVVQGPPGTGKTHTIANVICHYLAQGKRVLVTSMKDPALAVLQEKIPADIRPLAISLLTSEAEGMKQFEYSINKISAEVQRIDRATYRQEISQIDGKIDALHAKICRTDREIAGWASKNLDPISIDGSKLSPADAAKEVALNRSEIGWFKDKISITDKHKAQFSNADIVDLRQARLTLGHDLIYLDQHVPQLSDFPDTQKLLQVHQDLSRFAELKEQEATGQVPPLVNGSEETIQAALGLAARVSNLRLLQQELRSADQPWVFGLQKYLRNAGRNEILDLFLTLKGEIEYTLKQRKEFLSKPVSVPADLDKNAEVVQAISNLAEGTRPFGLAGLLGKGPQKKLLDAILIIDDKPNSTMDWAHVQKYIVSQKLSRGLLTRWNTLAGELPLPRFEVSPDRFTALGLAINLFDKTHVSIFEESALVGDLKRLIPTWKRSDQLSRDVTILDEAEAYLNHHMMRHRLAQTWVVKEAFLKALSGCTGVISSQIHEFLNFRLGNKDLDDAAIQGDWSIQMNELRRVLNFASQLKVISRVTSTIEASGAPFWATDLRLIPYCGTHDPILPDNWQEVWRLRRLTTHLDGIDARQDLKRLSKERTESENDLAKQYRDAVTKRTWLKLSENATNSVRAALEAYRTAIRKIGKGTGVRAVRYRQDARVAADRANSAIPCWIMPHYRVCESLPPSFGCFDLVIIDEASQSDLTALPAILRAKKVLIVGDDKQVSPEGVGLEEEKIRNLMGRFLANQVEIYRAQMTPERSIYDLFKVVFAKSSVMLREHFRCVAPIIEYSKREFYNHELRPLRLPKTSERIDPPLVDVYVEDGFRDSDHNPGEARFIVDEIRRIVSNPNLDRRTIGVVSLVGNEQALRVMKMLYEELGEEVVTRFHITCGDARTFQGKERDIMFLSMVVAPGRVHAQTQEMFAQRFNVAASRARDRMYLVRSVTLDDLSPADLLRSRLIQHFQAPFSQDDEEVADLRLLCESPFEREVFDALVERGYRVLPQVPVGAFRIDMVVEGDNDNRLAIECDGDQFHGPGQWDYDMRRQRILERAGWRFWRCFASTFVMKRDVVIADLVETLSAQGVKPSSVDSHVKSIHSETRIVRAFEKASISDHEDNYDDQGGSETDFKETVAEAPLVQISGTLVTENAKEALISEHAQVIHSKKVLQFEHAKEKPEEFQKALSPEHKKDLEHLSQQEHVSPHDFKARLIALRKKHGIENIPPSQSADELCDDGDMNFNGQGVQKNFEEAIKLYRLAAVQGNARGQNNLGVMYSGGQGVQQNFEEAVKWFRRAADQGYADAQTNLAGMYIKGHGVSQDYKEAVAWCRLAAAQKDHHALYNLGFMYSKGLGVQQDYSEAVRWYRLAATQGDTSALNNLGMLYFDGLGVTANPVVAYALISLSAVIDPSLENHVTRHSAPLVAASMSNKEIEDALNLACQLKKSRNILLTLNEFEQQFSVERLTLSKVSKKSAGATTPRLKSALNPTDAWPCPTGSRPLTEHDSGLSSSDAPDHSRDLDAENLVQAQEQARKHKQGLIDLLVGYGYKVDGEMVISPHGKVTNIHSDFDLQDLLEFEIATKNASGAENKKTLEEATATAITSTSTPGVKFALNPSGAWPFPTGKRPK